MPVFQLYMFVGTVAQSSNFFFKFQVFKNLTRCFSEHLWVFWIMNGNQTQLSLKCVFIALLLFLVMKLAHYCKLYDGLCSRGEPILVFSKIQLLLYVFSSQMVEIKQISIIPHDK